MMLLIIILTPSSLHAQISEVNQHLSYGELPAHLEFHFDEDLFLSKTKTSSKNVELSIPVSESDFAKVTLREVVIHAEGFEVTMRTENGEVNLPYSIGHYYTGKVNGDDNSKVNLSIQDGILSGTLFHAGTERIIGTFRNTRRQIIYVKDQLAMEAFTCETTSDYADIRPELTLPLKSSSCNETVEIYVECDHQMYQNFSSNTASVVNYVNTMFAEVAALYSAENLTVLLSQVMVWTTNDGYPSGTSALSSFANALNNTGFNGDLAHLLTNDSGSNGGVAYVNQLCGAFPYSYSDILNTSHPVPTYSWDVQVVTHELGHNFGSAHTHDCVWGPSGNTQLDDCGSIVIGGGSCYNPANPIVPSSGGTIMSYCHLNSVGINFNNGFGSEPGNLIRANHANCMCDNSTCDTSTELFASGSNPAQPSSGGGASHSNAVNADWYSFTAPQDGTISAYACNEGVDTRMHIHTGSCGALTLVASSDDDCTSAGNNTYASEISNFSVQAGTEYFIEWDDRWSSASFTWEFEWNPGAGSSVTISCPQDYMGEYTCSNDADPAVTGQATGSTGATISYADNITETSCSYLVDRVWTATAASGITATCQQYIDLTDNSSPSVSGCPSTINVTSGSNCQAIVSWPLPNASDACSAAITTTSTHQPNDSFAVGSHSVTYMFTDACGNASNCSFAINVADGCTAAPVNPCDGVNITLTGNITDDTHSAQIELKSSGTINSGLSPAFTAGQTMELLPGFELKPGATLEANIEDCQN